MLADQKHDRLAVTNRILSSVEFCVYARGDQGNDDEAYSDLPQVFHRYLLISLLEIIFMNSIQEIFYNETKRLKLIVESD